MHVIAKPILVEFWTKHPDAERPLEAWYRIIKAEVFADLNVLRVTFASADYVDGLTVFNIGGNKYRLIASIHYDRHKVYIRDVLTHMQYDRDGWKRKKEKLMAHHAAVPEAQAILRAWMPFKEIVGVTTVRTEEDHARALATIEVLLDEVGDNESHPLADVLDYLADQVEAYEAEHCHIPEAEPKAVLRFLMDQHNLKQEDLADCAPQSRISDLLNGRRDFSKEIAKKLARRFNVSAALFV